MKVVLGTFTCGAIEAFSGRDIAAGVHAALRHYARGEGSSRKAAELPCFFSESSSEHRGVDLELTVDPETEAMLEREARESGGVSLEQIATHAVLVYLADLDRAAEREARPLTWA